MPSVSSHIGHGAVAVTPHHEATAAALRVMQAGGTAADAVIAANAVLAMVLPTTCGIGGDLFAIVHAPGMEQPEVLNASGRGGSGLDATRLRDAGHTQIPYTGPESVSVPGAVDGWEALSERHGRLSLQAVLADAITFGMEGFEVSIELSVELARLADSLRGQPSAVALYPQDTAPATGAMLRRHDLATTLQAIAANGRSALYEGEVAAAIAHATEGILTTEDLSANTVDWVKPIGLDVLGLRGWTVPPNSQGYLTLAAAWLVEALAPPRDVSDPRFHHAVIEAYRAVAWERDDLIADAGHLPSPDRLLDPTRLTARLEEIDRARVTPWPATQASPGGTAYFCAIDSAGMAVSCIQSNYAGIGSRISAGTTGIFLHNRGAGFNLIPGHPNEAATGKRPLHTLAPSLWTRGTDTALVLGTRGGHQQPQYLVQMASAMLYVGLTAPEAQAIPRWHIEDESSSDKSVVTVEAGMPEQVVTGLTAMGHALTQGPSLPPGWGPVGVISIDRGIRTAAADPRVSTATADGD